MARKLFEQVQFKKPKMSAFDLSHERKLSFKMGDLIPILNEELVPGDQFKGSTESLIRMAPMLAPVMHRVNVYVHYFFVPNRVIWSEWEDFITGGRLGESTPTMPTMSLSSANSIHTGKGTTFDYFGIPQVNSSTPKDVSCLPFWAYRQIYNDYYRDQNLTEPRGLTTAVNSNKLIYKRAWEKDYFTSGLPFAQRGPQVGLPVTFAYKDVSDVYDENGNEVNPSEGLGAGFLPNRNELKGETSGDRLRIENLQETGGTLEDLRNSSALQRWLEKQARGGARYIETILSHFGVKSSDTRLQRAEYLGGGKNPIVISEVLNTSNTAEAPQGAMSGHGVSAGTSNSFKYMAEEHGWLMGIMSVLPRTAYQQGIHRKYSRTDKHDYYWPEFANLGEQEIKRQEIYADTATPEETFAYQQRYAEYKYACDSVHGDFRDDLDFWHMGRKFASDPPFNQSFVEANPTDRIFAVQDGTDTLWCQIYNDLKANRPMPYFANPSLR